MLRLPTFSAGVCLTALALTLSSSPLEAQQGAAPPPLDWSPSSGWPEPKTWSAAEEHRNMLEQLGITVLRPGPSGNQSAPNAANTDEALSNPYPNLPEVLTLKSGQKVTTA